MFAINFNVGDVVFKHGGYVDLREIGSESEVVRRVGGVLPLGMYPLRRRSRDRSEGRCELAVSNDEEKGYLSAGTVADDDELSPDFGHD